MESSTNNLAHYYRPYGRHTGLNPIRSPAVGNQRYGVANRLRALGEDDLADRLAYEE